MSSRITIQVTTPRKITAGRLKALKAHISTFLVKEFHCLPMLDVKAEHERKLHKMTGKSHITFD